jgi:hypothetical protein
MEAMIPMWVAVKAELVHSSDGWSVDAHAAAVVGPFATEDSANAWLYDPSDPGRCKLYEIVEVTRYDSR